MRAGKGMGSPRPRGFPGEDLVRGQGAARDLQVERP